MKEISGGGQKVAEAWLAGLSNEQRRHHKKALNPDLPHPYRPRHVTNGKAKFMPTYEHRFVGGRWRRVYATNPCRICGGSPGLKVHG